MDADGGVEAKEGGWLWPTWEVPVLLGAAGRLPPLMIELLSGLAMASAVVAVLFQSATAPIARPNTDATAMADGPRTWRRLFRHHFPSGRDWCLLGRREGRVATIIVGTRCQSPANSRQLETGRWVLWRVPLKSRIKRRQTRSARGGAAGVR